MDILIKQFKECTIVGDDEFQIFSNFYDSNLKGVREWLEERINKRETKCNTKAERLRKLGNEYYLKKDYAKSMDYYTASLLSALVDTEVYSLSLSNRSAVFCAIGDYENCLKDLNICFNSCPERIKPKLLLRKAECYFNLNVEDYLQETVKDTKEFIINNNCINNKEKEDYMKKLKKFEIITPKQKEKSSHNEIPLPNVKDSPNESFLFASSALKLMYNETKGRYVIATKDINVGDVLFVEKAFSFTPVFFKDGNDVKLHTNKCFHCLKDSTSCIPCRNCTIVVYCTEECRVKSWEEFHQWECIGMQSGIWCEIGIGFPAFRAFLKGIPSGFEILKTTYIDDTVCFGNKSDNYPYFNKLVTNFSKMKDVTPILICAAIAVLYLDNHTNFFDQLLTTPKCPNQNKKELVQFCGGLISRHIAQLSCNSSIIEHWLPSSQNEAKLPSSQVQVACGIYPTISMMNHSCNPNISMYFVYDTAIVKAIRTIKKGSEVFNCYGMNFQFVSKSERQEKCKKLYYFTCECDICQNLYLEMEYTDSFLCSECEGPIPYNNTNEKQSCMQCGKLTNITELIDTKNKVVSLLSSSCPIEKDIISCLQFIRKYFYKKHSFFVQVYKTLCEIYSDKGDIKNLVKYSNFLIETINLRMGENSRTAGIYLHILCNSILKCLQEKELSDIREYSNEIHTLSRMKDAMKIILNLYYHLEVDRFKALDFSVNVMLTLLDSADKKV